MNKKPTELNVTIAGGEYEFKPAVKHKSSFARQPIASAENMSNLKLSQNGRTVDEESVEYAKVLKTIANSRENYNVVADGLAIRGAVIAMTAIKDQQFPTNGDKTNINDFYTVVKFQIRAFTIALLENYPNYDSYINVLSKIIKEAAELLISPEFDITPIMSYINIVYRVFNNNSD